MPRYEIKVIFFGNPEESINLARVERDGNRFFESAEIEDEVLTVRTNDITSGEKEAIVAMFRGISGVESIGMYVLGRKGGGRKTKVDIPRCSCGVARLRLP